MDPEVLSHIVHLDAHVVCRYTYRQALVGNVEGITDLDRDYYEATERYYMGKLVDNHTVCVVELDGQQYAIWFHDAIIRVGPVSALQVQRY